jgi:putative Ca2+/H+ antiporter (TMEM165/GDT1 family)
MDLRLLASTYAVIFAAELPDKTALASLVLATRHRPLPVLLGAGLALTVQSVVATLAGGLISLLPHRAVEIGTGLVFLASALWMWLRRSEDEKDGAAPALGFWPVLRRVFVVVFLAEWGDLTQVGTAALAAHSRAPLTVFVGATLALWSVVALAVLVGNRAGRLLDPGLTKKVAAVLFALVGLVLLVGV